MEVLQQPERVARAKAEGVARAGQAVGAATGVGSLAVGGGLYSYGQANKKAAFRQAELDEQKLKVIGGILNDPNTSAGDKAAIVEALSMAGVFKNPEKAKGWFDFDLGGSVSGSGGGGGLLGGSLSPALAFGGGLSGMVITLVVIWAAVQMWEAYQTGGGGGAFGGASPA